MIGQTISHYRIKEKLGQGGMGLVYKADDLKLEREVAIKFLPAHLASEEENRERLIREAKSASALNHPNVCIIHSIEEIKKDDKEPVRFIVMEYVSGTTLRKKNEEGPQKINDAILYGIQIAEALKEAHSKDIAHLDIKSDNIMINSQNQVKVMDFGLAKLRNADSEPHYEGTYGTAAYMSPEQALGKPAGFKSDIWSFGIVFYEMLTGKLPFVHNYEEAIIYSILNEDPVPPSSVRSDITPALEKIILTCLEKEEADRYPDFNLLLTELKKIKEGIDSLSIRETYEKEQKGTKKETEQKQATIVFMKINEYSEMLEKVGHENFVVILEKCYEIVNKVTLKYGGTVNKTHVSDIVLYFGLPFTIENSAQKALNAAIEISESFSEVIKVNNLPINPELKIGINTGIVIAGSISSGAKMEYTVIGDTVEIASKLLELSSAGQILVGPVTYRYTKNNFELKPVKTVSVKGKRDPIQVYSLESNKIKTNKSLEVGRLIHSEMVGRINELEKIEFLLQKAIKGEGSIVSIIADAGIGKSRLLSEFKKKDILQQALLLEGKALSTTRNVSFHPVIEILRQWAQINENDNEKEAFSKLENSVQHLFNDEANEIIPFIAQLMGFQLSGEYAKRVNDVSVDTLNKMIQRSMKLLILKGSEVKPVVFIIEDLHWADQSSLELLQSLLRLAENNKILFISTLRPNYQETGDRIISSIREKYSAFYSEINLEPLNSKDCEILLHNLLRTDIPVRLKNSVSKSTEGNPFFIEEVVRSLIDDNIIEIKNNQFHISQTVGEIEIPGTIKDVLLSRIDKLDEPAKNLLKIASVIGRYFLYEILKNVAKGIEDIDTLIKSLEKLELIKENNATAEREFLFKHALVQEAVYETLLQKNKQELHLKVANAIEDLYSGKIQDFYETLAHHYSLANDKDKAEEYLIKAGERTLKTAASYEALNYFQEALKLYLQKYGNAADKEKIFMLEKNIGFSFYNRGYFKDAVEHFNKALETRGINVQRNKLNELFRFGFNFFMIIKSLYLNPQKKNPPSDKEYILFDILFKNVTAYANYDGKKMFLELLNLVRMKMDYKLSGEDGWGTYSLTSSLFSYSGISFSLSNKFIKKANDYAKLYGIDNIYHTGYDETLNNCLTGNWKNFSKINERLLEVKLRSGELIYTIYQISWALYITICRGNYNYAEYLITKGDEISEAYDFDYGKLYMLSMKADLELNRRDLSKAIRLFTESVDLAEKLGLNSWILGLSGKRAKAYTLLDEFQSAKESLDKAEKALKEADTLTPMLLSYYTAYKLFYFVRLYESKVNDNSKAGNEIALLEKEIEKSKKTAVKVANKVAEIKPEVDRYIGTYYWIKNKPDKAVKYMNQSIEFAKHLDALPELGRSYLKMGKILLQTQTISWKMNVGECFSEAQKIFEYLNLVWDLDELNRLRDQSVSTIAYNYSHI